MRRFFFNIISSLAILISISSCVTHKHLENDEQRVKLSIKISLLDRVAVTRGEATADELMKNLRVILFRENGILEYNDLIVFGTSTEISDVISIDVIPNETKRLYLLANAQGLLDLNTESGLESRINSCVVSGDMPMPLPISGVHTVEIGNTDVEIAQPLFLTRVANKFTFNVKNSTSAAIKLTKVEINKVADRTYLMPRINQNDWLNMMITELGKDEDRDEQDHAWITDYDLPSGTTHSTKSISLSSSIASNATRTLDPIYVHESKHIPSGSEQSYTISLTIDGMVYVAKLPILESLVRNTHVKVDVEYLGTNIVLVFDVVPFDKINNSLVFE